MTRCLQILGCGVVDEGGRSVVTTGATPAVQLTPTSSAWVHVPVCSQPERMQSAMDASLPSQLTWVSQMVWLRGPWPKKAPVKAWANPLHYNIT